MVNQRFNHHKSPLKIGAWDFQPLLLVSLIEGWNQHSKRFSMFATTFNNEALFWGGTSGWMVDLPHIYDQVANFNFPQFEKYICARQTMFLFNESSSECSVRKIQVPKVPKKQNTYGYIYLHIFHEHQLNVGKYTSPIDSMGWLVLNPHFVATLCSLFRIAKMVILGCPWKWS